MCLMPDIVVEIQQEVTDVEVIVSPQEETTIVVEVNSVNSGHTHINNEVPNGIINGSNNTFTSFNDFIPESVVLSVNGLAMKPIEDYITTGTNTVIFNFSPQVGENILLNYIKI